MLQDTAARLKGLESLGPPIVVCNEAHRFMVAEQLRRLDTAPGSIILEPVGRNTAPAVAVAALVALKADAKADPILLVLPADHVIEDVPAFHAAARIALAQAGEGKLVTFGVVARSPETGYGYIRRAGGRGPAYPVAQFVEKPDTGVHVSSLNQASTSGTAACSCSRLAATCEELDASRRTCSTCASRP